MCRKFRDCLEIPVPYLWLMMMRLVITEPSSSAHKSNDKDVLPGLASSLQVSETQPDAFTQEDAIS